MRKLTLNFLFPLIALFMLVVLLDRQVFTTPPLARTLNPFIGIIQNEKDLRSDKTMDLDLEKRVDVHFDNRDVPHLFAANQSDLFFAQGYVSASDRLWQMDFMSYVSAGRLSELFGKNLLEYDRTQRRNGMLYSAKVSLIYMEKNPETKIALDHYTAGVNAWIEQLSYKDYPMEYKLMDYKPEPWTNLKTVLVIKYISAVLSGYENDVPSSVVRLALGEEKYDQLFPDFYLADDSISYSLKKISHSLDKLDYLDYSFLETGVEVLESNFNPYLGSNSWAISADKSATGNALLCADPHLNLTLPSIWYEIQLKSDLQNVYGFSIPGVPGVLIGFNDQISWGLTNGSADVIDYHKLTLNQDYSAYRYDGKWLKTVRRIEKITVRNEKTLYDTVYYAKQGPIASDAIFGDPMKRGFALDWSLHNPSNELLTFLQINKARNNKQFLKAIEHYKCPAQNFSYADVAGNIGMYFRGDILFRHWKDQGNFILDGSRSDHFTNRVVKELPSSFNPEVGYVFSANNNPYRALGAMLIYGDYDEFRADRIDALLRSKERFTIDEMKAMQLDNKSRMAELALPILMKVSGKSKSHLRKELKGWNCEFNAESHAAVIFSEWWNTISTMTWDELSRLRRGAEKPSDLILMNLIRTDPTNAFFDLESTEKVESASDIVIMALLKIEKTLDQKKTWGELNKLKIPHLSNIDQLGRSGILNGGSPNAINAFTADAGPSLRMIVDMSNRPQGYGIYSGGQTGNPASPNYDQFMEDWLDGKYYKLNFYHNQRESKSSYKWILK